MSTTRSRSSRGASRQAASSPRPRASWWSRRQRAAAWRACTCSSTQTRWPTSSGRSTCRRKTSTCTSSTGYSRAALATSTRLRGGRQGGPPARRACRRRATPFPQSLTPSTATLAAAFPGMTAPCRRRLASRLGATPRRRTSTPSTASPTGFRSASAAPAGACCAASARACSERTCRALGALQDQGVAGSHVRMYIYIHPLFLQGTAAAAAGWVLHG
mmetsp:Transcript_4941/g.15028  ORF Transcript_4941/g.15028 Transcript_4941/m.15028 type:complete len:217 (+) Transcript_4941:754-1404(+)